MSKKVGLWIDHHQAVIVSVTGEDEETKIIHSNIEKQGQSGNQADDIKLRVLTEHRNIYYRQVISYLRDAEAFFVFGPGEAKGELEKRLAKDHPDRRAVTVETTDKMTDSRIVEKVKKHFLHHGAMRIMPN